MGLLGCLRVVGWLQAVWYVCLKTENYYLKIFVKIRVNEKNV